MSNPNDESLERPRPEFYENLLWATAINNVLPIEKYLSSWHCFRGKSESDKLEIATLQNNSLKSLLRNPINPFEGWDAPQTFKKINFTSRINVDDIDKLPNLSVFKTSVPTNNLFKEKKSKWMQWKNNNRNYYVSHAEEVDEIDENCSFAKCNNTKNRGYKAYGNQGNIGNGHNESTNSNNSNNNNRWLTSSSYMDTKPWYAKKKGNPCEEMDDEEPNDGSLNYSSSIYNINKKKKKFAGYGNNNYNKKKNNNYKKGYNNNPDEEDEEEAEYVNNTDNNNQKFTGFQSAITITNKVMKNNKVSCDYLKENNNNNNSSSSGNNSNYNSNQQQNQGGFKKFQPPVKKDPPSSVGKTAPCKQSYNDDTNNTGDKDKELDEKLKGFDKKMIEFIQSEIWSSSPNINWDDIAGWEFAKKTIKEIIIWPLLRPDLFGGIRRPPKGLLLFGPPGTGKTMIAKAIASQSKSQFFNISASSLMSKWIGESERLVRTLFALASYYQPSVVFIDEIDSILTARSENECEASRRIKTEFLVQLDGAGTNADDRILIIGATNRPQEIDDAFIRRLSKRLYIPLPNKASRKQLIMNVLKKEREKNNKYDITDLEIDDIIGITKGYSGSDMISVCREAAMMPIRSIEDIENLQLEHLRGVNRGDFLMSIDNVKPSVSDKTIGQYVEWNKEFGSFQFEDKDE